MSYEVQLDKGRRAGGVLVKDIPTLEKALSTAQEIMRSQAKMGPDMARDHDEISVYLESYAVVFRAEWVQNHWRVSNLMSMPVDYGLLRSFGTSSST